MFSTLRPWPSTLRWSTPQCVAPRQQLLASSPPALAAATATPEQGVIRRATSLAPDFERPREEDPEETETADDLDDWDPDREETSAAWDDDAWDDDEPEPDYGDFWRPEEDSD